MTETTKSKKNDVELKQDEAIPSSTPPETQHDEMSAKEFHELKMKCLAKVLAKEDDSDKYAAKYLAKATHAKDFNPDEQTENAEAIQRAKGQALSLLIDDEYINNKSTKENNTLQVKSVFAERLFSGLSANDEHLDAKLTALTNAARQYKNKFDSFIPEPYLADELDKAKELAHSIRKNIHYAFSHLN